MSEYTFDESSISIVAMSVENKIITNWHEKASEAELAWINENLPAFQQFAAEQYDEQGRGVILVNTGLSSKHQSHPYWYLPQAIIEDTENEQDIQHVREYDPQNEIIIIFQKPEIHSTTHRIPITE